MKLEPQVKTLVNFQIHIQSQPTVSIEAGIFNKASLTENHSNDKIRNKTKVEAADDSFISFTAYPTRCFES